MASASNVSWESPPGWRPDCLEPTYDTMPLEREQLTLAVLLLCVPLQYFAGRYMGSNEISRSFAISKMVSSSRQQPSWSVGTREAP